MDIVREITEDTPFFWLIRDSGKVKIVFGSFAEISNETGTKKGPYNSDAEAVNNIKDVFSL